MLSRTADVVVPRNWTQTGRHGALVVVSALLARLVVLAAASRDQALLLGGDTHEYLALADDPAAYRDGSSPSWDLTFSRPPGYPMLLAPIRALSSSLLVAGLFQVVLGTLAALLTYRVGLAILGARPALLAGLWVALDPATVASSTRLLTEVPFTIAFAVWVLSATRAVRDRSGAWAAAAGAALAAATFLRPISLYLPVLVAPLLYLAVRARPHGAPRPGRGHRRAARPIAVALAFTLAFALPVGGWILRNQGAGGVTTFSTIEGVNLLDYRAAASIAEEEGTDLATGRTLARQALAEEGAPPADGPVLDHRKARVGRRLILEHPAGYLVQAAKGLIRTLIGAQRSELSDLTTTVRGGSVLEPVLTGAALVSALLLAAGSAAGAVAAARRRDLAVVVALVVPLAYMLLVGSGAESDARFRLPLIPAMALLAAYAMSLRGADGATTDPGPVVDLREPIIAPGDGRPARPWSVHTSRGALCHVAQR